jgi:hypothetical protein
MYVSHIYQVNGKSSLCTIYKFSVSPSRSFALSCDAILFILAISFHLYLLPRQFRIYYLIHTDGWKLCAIRVPVWNLDYIIGVLVRVLLAADSQATSSSGYRASLLDPWPDFSLLFFLRLTVTLVFFLRSNHSLVRLLMPNNHTLPSHLRLCALFVDSYDSQGLRWKYSNPPPHGVYIIAPTVLFITSRHGPCRKQRFSAGFAFVRILCDQ